MGSEGTSSDDGDPVRPGDADRGELPPLSELVLGLADIGALHTGPVAGAAIPGESLPGLWAESIETVLPVELDVVHEDGGVVSLGCSPPTIYTRTSLERHFHTLRVHLVRTGGDG